MGQCLLPPKLARAQEDIRLDKGVSAVLCDLSRPRELTRGSVGVSFPHPPSPVFRSAALQRASQILMSQKDHKRKVRKTRGRKTKGASA